MIYTSEQGPGRDRTMLLDLRGLEQLVALARGASTCADEVAEPTHTDHRLSSHRAAGYAAGVTAALGWLAGHHADDQLTELLGIDEDQR